LLRFQNNLSSIVRFLKEIKYAKFSLLLNEFFDAFSEAFLPLFYFPVFHPVGVVTAGIIGSSWVEQVADTLFHQTFESHLHVVSLVIRQKYVCDLPLPIDHGRFEEPLELISVGVVAEHVGSLTEEELYLGHGHLELPAALPAVFVVDHLLLIKGGVVVRGQEPEARALTAYLDQRVLCFLEARPDKALELFFTGPEQLPHHLQRHVEGQPLRVLLLCLFG